MPGQTPQIPSRPRPSSRPEEIMSTAPHLARGGGDRSLDMVMKIRDIITIMCFTQLTAPHLVRGGGDRSLDMVMKIMGAPVITKCCSH